jgi:hypothetical protein
VPATHECFVPSQMLVVLGATQPGSPRFETLAVRPEGAQTGAEAAGLLRAGLRLTGRTIPSSWNARWDARPDEIASRAEVEQALLAAGIPYAHLGDPPTRGNLCTILAQYWRNSTRYYNKPNSLRVGHGLARRSRIGGEHCPVPLVPGPKGQERPVQGRDILPRQQETQLALSGSVTRQLLS